jgi:hypothetical protein
VAKKPSAPPPDNIKREKFPQSLRVQLTPDEIADRADRAAHKVSVIAEKKAELKAVSTHQKGIIETVEAELSLLSKEVRDKSTYAQVECERQLDFNEGTYREIRLDTGEMLIERKLLESEKQRELPFPDDDDSAHTNGNAKHDPNKSPKPGASGPIGPVEAAPAPDESWRPIPITEALPGLGKKIYEGMEKLNLHTLGELITWKNEREHRRWTDIDGLGEAGATKIDDAMEVFWTAYGKRKPAATE